MVSKFSGEIIFQLASNVWVEGLSKDISTHPRCQQLYLSCAFLAWASPPRPTPKGKDPKEEEDRGSYQEKSQGDIQEELAIDKEI